MGKRTNTAVWMDKHQRWQIKVQKDGIRKTFYSSKPGRTGQREANAKADAWLDEGVVNSNIKVKDVFALYLEDLKLRTSKGNWRPLDQRANKWILPVIGSLKLSALTDQKLQDVINRAFSEGELSKKSLCNLRADMTSLLKFCRKSKLTAYVPEDIIIPARATKTNKAILQPEELRILLTESLTTTKAGRCVEEPYINGYRLQVLTGLRPGELLGLRKSDRKGNVIHVQRSINIDGEVTSGKNENARRDVILGEEAQKVWDDQASRVSADELFPGISSQNYWAHLRMYCDRWGLTRVSPYGLRHTFVSIAKTLPEGLVKDLVGHSKQMDTFGVYGHALNNDNGRIQVAIDSRFLELLADVK